MTIPAGRTPRIGGFRKDAAALVIDQHRTIADVAGELGVVEQMLGNCIRREPVDQGEREARRLRCEENARLRRVLKRLTIERDLLKRSVALWVKGQGR